MGEFIQVEARTMVAAQDMTAKQYHILRASAAGECQIASNAGGGGQEVVGVLQSKPNSGQNASVGYFGVSKIVAGGAVAANKPITTNTSGRAAVAASGDWVFGQSLTAATTDGEVISALLRFPAVHAPSSLATL